MGEWCFCWAVNRVRTSTVDRGAVLRANQWPQQSVIRVGFLDGDSAARKIVRDDAVRWLSGSGGPANLQIDFVPDNEKADVRVRFKPGGSWSVIGTSCKNIKDGAKPTMNFGWLDKGTTEAEARRVVLHEFGHALGLVHEHLNPAVDVQWDKEAVYKTLSDDYGWDRAIVDANLFKAHPLHEVIGTPFDAKSVMLYRIPPEWTLNRFSTTQNYEMSKSDRAIMAQVYP